MAKAKKIDGRVERVVTERVVEAERYELSLTPLEAHAIQRLCSVVGGTGRLRDASNAVSVALDAAGVDDEYLSYVRCAADRHVYEACVEASCWWISEDMLLPASVAKLDELQRRSETTP